MLSHVSSNIGGDNLLMAVYMMYPLLYLALGYFNKKHPPKYPPDVYGEGTMKTTYGYQTPTSRKSRENWVKAQEYFVKYMMTSGYTILVFALLVLVGKLIHLIDDNVIFYILMGTMIIHAIGAFIYCESRLKKD